MTKSVSNTTFSVKLNLQEQCYLPIRSSLGRHTTNQIFKRVSKSVFEWQRLCKAGGQLFHLHLSLGKHTENKQKT